MVDLLAELKTTQPEQREPVNLLVEAQSIASAQPLGSIESLQDLHSRQVSGEQISNDEFKAASQGLSQEQQLQAFKAGRETTFDRAVGDVVGGAEGFATLASGALATPVAGIAGAVETLNPFSEEGAGARRVKQVQEALTFQPRTEEGKQALEPIQKLGEKIESGKKFLGRDTLEATGSPFLASIAHTLPDATLSLLGLKTVGKPTPQQAAQAQGLKQIKQPFSKVMTKSDKAIAKLLLEKSDKVKTAGVKLSADNLKSKLIDSLPRVVKHKPSINAMKQGLSEKSTAIIGASNKVERVAYNKMLKVVNDSLESGTYEATNRVGQVVGKTLLNRVTEVARINRRAGANIDKVAKTNLTGKAVETASIADNFNSSLNKLKVNIVDKKMNFAGSDIEGGISGAATAQKILKLTNQRLNSAGNNALKLHELKGFIDKQVKFGKSSSGSAGGAEDALKSLRREINNVLRKKSKEYASVNDKFSTTKDLLNEFQDFAGQKFDFTKQFADKALGVKTRALTNNTVGRSNMLELMANMEDVLVKNKVRFKDRIVPQVVVANDLESLFKLEGKTSAKGIAADVVTDTMTGSNIQATVKAGKGIKDLLSNKSPDKAIKAIRELLKETK